MFKRLHVRHAAAAAVAIVAVLLSTFVGLAQGGLELGGLAYSRAAAPALRMPVTRSAGFFSRVGGVAFSAVANGEDGLFVSGLRYEASAADGQRLAVTLRRPDGTTLTVRPHIFDWQLVPIARYAMDENGSAVTLFGRLQDKNLEARTRAARNGRAINYNPRLDNTLVGLRLLQADMLIIYPDAADLFREGSRILLGAGEQGHDLTANQRRFAALAEWQEEQSLRGNEYQSYVVGDIDQHVTFSVRNGTLTFTGRPYWDAWRRKHRSAADRANATRLVDAYEADRATYNALVGKIKGGTATAQDVDRQRRLGEELETIEAQFEELNAVEEMPEYSRALSDRIAELDGVNPIVYRNLVTVMHYRALFKHFQRRNRPGFTAFVNSLTTVALRPDVRTPTVQREQRAE